MQHHQHLSFFLYFNLERELGFKNFIHFKEANTLEEDWRENLERGRTWS